MKIFIVNVKETEWDCIESVAVLAKSKVSAIDLAIKYDRFFEGNIGEIEEMDIDSEKVIHGHIIYG